MKKYTPEEQRKYIQEIEELTDSYIHGKDRLTFQQAIDKLGIHSSSYHAWLEIEENREFFQELRRHKDFKNTHESEGIISDVISGSDKIPVLDKFRSAMNLQKNTNRKYNIAIEQQGEVEAKLIGKSKDVLDELKEVIRTLPSGK